MTTDNRIINCEGCGECRIYMSPYVHCQERHDWVKFRKLKAGICFYNDEKGQVLIIQSRGDRWGLPKGSMEDCDTEEFTVGSPDSIKLCATREAMEETGIRVDPCHLTVKYTTDKTTYFLINVCKQPKYMEYINQLNSDSKSGDIDNNDATGISWIYVSCLLKTPSLVLNSHCKKILKYLFGV